MRPIIQTLPLFSSLNDHLLSFLRGLSPNDWERPTIARQWKVKDVVAHLLDGNFRQLSIRRDHWQLAPAEPVHSFGDLVDYLNEFNGSWVKAAQRLSPALLIELLAYTHDKVIAVFSSLDPAGPAIYPVSWAGEEMSTNSFDIAREYTERWLHQQQVRYAMNDTTIESREFYHPVLDIFLQAWPFTLKGTEAPEGTVAQTTILGAAGGDWWCQRIEGRWELVAYPDRAVSATTIMDERFAWQLFSKSVRKEQISAAIERQGDLSLANQVLDMVSVMA